VEAVIPGGKHDAGVASVTPARMAFLSAVFNIFLSLRNENILAQ
jgi:hypothetical protein